MAFIIDGGGNVVSFAEFTDVSELDSRLFEENEVFTQDNVEELLERSTQRILQKVKASVFWRTYVGGSISLTGLNELPTPDPNKFQRRADVTDLCVYHCMANYLLPKVADFGNPEDSENQKMRYYEQRFGELFEELVTLGDFYDNDGDGTVETDEKLGRFSIPRRTRGRRPIARIR